MRKLAFILSLILIFMIPWEEIVIIQGVGRVSRVAGLPIAAFWAATVIATGKFRQLRPFHIVIFLYLLWNSITILWTVDYGTTLRRITTYVQLAGMIWLLWDLYTTPAAVRAGVQAYVLGAFVSVYSTISNYFAGVSRGAIARYSASGFNPNDLALILVLGLPLAWYLAVSSTESEGKVARLLKILNFSYVPLGILSILLTASRTALFSMMPILWFMLGSITRLKPVSRLLIAVALGISFFVIQPLIPQTSIERLSSTQSEIESGTLSGRRDIWDAAIPVFLEQPITGYGSGSFKTAVGFKDKSAHNIYILLLVESGLVGFTLIFGVIFVMAVFHTKHLPRWEAALWLVTLSAWLINNLTVSWDLKKATWLILSMVVISANLYREQTREIQHERYLSRPGKLTSPFVAPSRKSLDATK